MTNLDVDEDEEMEGKTVDLPFTSKSQNKQSLHVMGQPVEKNL